MSFDADPIGTKDKKKRKKTDWLRQDDADVLLKGTADVSNGRVIDGEKTIFPCSIEEVQCHERQRSMCCSSVHSDPHIADHKRTRTSYSRYQTLELEKEFHFNR